MVGNFPYVGIIHSIGFFGLGQVLNTGGGVPASAVWPTANKAFYIPFTIVEPTVFDRGYTTVGTVAGGDFDIGVFSTPGFAKVASTGAVGLGPSTATVQVANFTSEFYLKRGIYLLGMSLSTNTATTIRINVGSDGGLTNSIGVKEEASAHPLPATATPATTTAGYLPLFGILAKGTY